GGGAWCGCPWPTWSEAYFSFQCRRRLLPATYQNPHPPRLALVMNRPASWLPLRRPALFSLLLPRWACLWRLYFPVALISARKYAEDQSLHTPPSWLCNSPAVPGRRFLPLAPVVTGPVLYLRPQASPI